jgi:hypothetical protein
MWPDFLAAIVMVGFETSGLAAIEGAEVVTMP